METHLSQFDDLLRQVRLSGGKLDDDLIACMLLLKLPGSLNVVILYVPHLRKYVLSAGKIEQNGLSIVLNNGKAEIQNKNGS